MPFIKMILFPDPIPLRSFSSLLRRTCIGCCIISLRIEPDIRGLVVGSPNPLALERYEPCGLDGRLGEGTAKHLSSMH